MNMKMQIHKITKYWFDKKSRNKILNVSNVAKAE